MLRRTRQHCRRLIAVLLACALAAPSFCRAGSAEEYEEKANQICGFIRNTQWNGKRAGGPNVPFVIGIYGADALSESLREINQNRLAKGRPVHIMHITAPQQARACNILFVSRSESDRLGSILAEVRREGVLTVGESPNFLKAGGVINFVNTPQGVGFEVNVENAQREQLTFDGKMLNAAVRPAAKGPSIARTDSATKIRKVNPERD